MSSEERIGSEDNLFIGNDTFMSNNTNKKRRKKKKNNSKKINIEKFITPEISTEENYPEKLTYKNEYYDNFSPEAEKYEDDYYYRYDLLNEELFEEMVCKVGDYFQNSINELIDNFCYDLLYILDENSYIEDVTNSFCEEINDELKSIFQKISKNKHIQINFNEDDAESIFEPFSDPFFAVFLDAHDYSDVPSDRTTINKLRNLRAKVSSMSRESRKKLENSYSDLTIQLNQLDDIQSYIDRITMQNEANLKHLEELKNQKYGYLCKNKSLEYQMESISNQSKFFLGTSNITSKNFDKFSKLDVNNNIKILSGDIQSYLNDQISLKDKFSEKQAQLKKCKINSFDLHKDFLFINEILSKNLERAVALSIVDSDLESKSTQKDSELNQKSVQLQSFVDNSFLEFKRNCQKSRKEKEKYIEDSQLFINSIKEENTFYSKI